MNESLGCQVISQTYFKAEYITYIFLRHDVPHTL